MSRTTRLLHGVAFGYANQVLVTLVGIWLTAFLLGRLGQADYGVWLLGTRILGYLLLLDVGVVALLPREVAFATGRASGVAAATDLPEIIGRTARIVLWQTPLVTVASLSVWLLLPTEWEPLRAPLAVVLGVSVGATGFGLGAALINGDGDLFVKLYRTAHLLGSPVDAQGVRRFASGGVLGDALLLAMLTARHA